MMRNLPDHGLPLVQLKEHLRDIHLARLLGVEERVHGARQRAHRATAADAFAIQAFEEVIADLDAELEAAA